MREQLIDANRQPAIGMVYFTGFAAFGNAYQGVAGIIGEDDLAVAFPTPRRRPMNVRALGVQVACLPGLGLASEPAGLPPASDLGTMAAAARSAPRRVDPMPPGGE
jgi:hypothetical protein